ncbi:MAG TPA: prepilin peptidase [Terriglobales bacterium]|nr:prepilin peptidase [Terriglobales bacterium]
MFGSFLNVCIYRMPREISVVSPRSACPACGTAIAFYDNVPVLSWVVLRGKCRNCKSRISPRYAIVELITGLLFVAAYLAPQAAWFAEHFRAALVKSFPVDVLYDASAISIRLCVFSFLLIGLIFTDAETKLLPDLLTKPGIVAGLAFSLWAAVEGPAGYFLQSADNWRLLSLLNSIAGAVMGSAFILGIALAYEALRGVEGMGRGDVKLMALIGAFLGVKLTLLVLLLGSLIGSLFGILLILIVWRKRLARRRAKLRNEAAGKARSRAWKSAVLIYRNFEIPFGVFLGAAALFSAFCGQALIDWYMSFYR